MDTKVQFGEADAQTESTQMSRKHLFAVNGSAGFLDLIRMLFQDERINVTTTNYVEGTLAQIAVVQPDILLIDLVVRRHAGWALLEELKNEALTRGIPMIVTSNRQDLLDGAEAEREKYAGDKYFVKPFDLDEIMATVHEVVGNA